MIVGNPVQCTDRVADQRLALEKRLDAVKMMLADVAMMADGVGLGSDGRIVSLSRAINDLRLDDGRGLPDSRMIHFESMKLDALSGRMTSLMMQLKALQADAESIHDGMMQIDDLNDRIDSLDAVTA